MGGQAAGRDGSGGQTAEETHEVDQQGAGSTSVTITGCGDVGDAGATANAAAEANTSGSNGTATMWDSGETSETD